MLLRYINTSGREPIMLTADALIDNQIKRVTMQVWKPIILADKTIGEIFNGNVTTQRVGDAEKYTLTSVDKEISEDQKEWFLAVENGEDVTPASTVCEIAESELPPDLIFGGTTIHDVDPFADGEDPFEDEAFAEAEAEAAAQIEEPEAPVPEPAAEPAKVKPAKKEKVEEAKPAQTKPSEPEKTANSMEKKTKTPAKEEKEGNYMEKTTDKVQTASGEAVLLSRIFDVKFGIPIVRTELIEEGQTYTHETILNEAVIKAEIAAFDPTEANKAVEGRKQYNCTLEEYSTKYVIQRISYEENGKKYVQERLVAEAS